MSRYLSSRRALCPKVVEPLQKRCSSYWDACGTDCTGKSIRFKRSMIPLSLNLSSQTLASVFVDFVGSEVANNDHRRSAITFYTMVKDERNVVDC